MTAYGLDPTGFTSYPATDIKDSLDASYKAGVLGDGAGSNPDGSIPLDSVAGQFETIDVDALSALWDLGLALYRSFDPDSATGDAQDNLCALTGTLREGPVASTVTALCVGAAGTALLAGRVASVSTANTRFDSQGLNTIAGVPSWVGSATYALGDLVTNGSTPARVYLCITPGQAAGAGGPLTTSLDITDNAAHWRYVGDGNGAVRASFVCETAGPLQALQWALDTISSPVDGWNAVTNEADAVQGNYRESDPALRIRRKSELAGDGASTADAIRAKVLKVGEGTGDVNRIVTACRVFYNDSDTTDANGLPPHGFMALVSGGQDAEVAAAIWAVGGGGIKTHGSYVETVTDSAGNSQTVAFERPTPIPIYIDIAVTYDPDTFPATGGDALIQEALVYYGLTYAAGMSVRAALLEAAAVTGPAGTTGGVPNAPVPGILDVTHLYIGTSYPAVASTTIPITAVEQATFSDLPGHITVTLTPGTP